MSISAMNMGASVRVVLLAFLISYCGTQGQVISEPDDVTICKGEKAMFTCVLNTTDNNINNDDVQWYRLVKDTGITEIVDQQGIYVITATSADDDTLTSQLTITNVNKSHTGYYWVRTPSFNVCNASLTVLTSPPPLTVNISKNIESSSIVLQWDAVDDFLITTYVITWKSNATDIKSVAVIERTSYIITGLTLDTVYTLTVIAYNKCGERTDYTNKVSLYADTTSTTSSISPTVTANTFHTTTTTNTMMNPGTTLLATITDSRDTDTSSSVIPSKTTSIQTSTISSAFTSTATTITITTLSISTVTNMFMSPNATETPTDTTPADDNGDSSIYTLVGVLIGGIIVVLLLFITFCCFWRRKSVYTCVCVFESSRKKEYRDLTRNDTRNKKDIPMVPNPLNTYAKVNRHDKLEGSKVDFSSNSRQLDPTDHTYDKLPDHVYDKLPNDHTYDRFKTDHTYDRLKNDHTYDSLKPLNPYDAYDKPPPPIKAFDTSYPHKDTVQSDQPVEHSNQPGVQSDQPGVRNDQPGVHNDQPGVHSDQPGVRNDQPGVHSDQPDDQSGVRTDQPGVHSDQPGVGNVQPGVCSDQPGVHNDQPGVRNIQPSVRSDQSPLNYAVLQTLPPPTDAHIAENNSRTSYALLS